MPVTLFFRVYLNVVALVVFGSSFPAATALAAGSPQVWLGAKILNGKGEAIENGALVVQDGKITAVGPMDRIAMPEGAEKIDVSGRVIIPGIVDTHSHLGVYSRPAVPANSDGNEMTNPVGSGVRAMDALYPDDPGIQMALAGGVTSGNIMPGSGNVIGGQTVYVKYRGRTVEEMMIKSPRTVGGLKMANGENPKRAYGSKGKAPGTRMKTFALQREQFIKAREYMRKWDAYRTKLAEGKDVNPPDVNLDLEPLVEVLQNKRTVHFHTHRADDIRSVLRLKDEFGFDLVIQHGTESYKIASEIAQRHVPVSMTILDSPGGKAECINLSEECGRELNAAGVKVIINTDDPITESRFLLRTGGIAVRGGLPEEVALKALTSHAAEALRLDDRIGSLETGKDADFVVLNGAPFSIWTRVLQTYIDGRKMFDIADERQRTYQSGGFDLPRAERPPWFAPAPPPAPLGKPLALPAATRPIDDEASEFRILARTAYTVAQGAIQDALIHVKGGKIESIKGLGGADVPTDLPLLSVTAVTPGLIDAFSTVPLSGEFNIPADQDVDEKSDPNGAELRVLDGFNPEEPLLKFLLAEGVTTVHACPGQHNVLAGLSGVFRTTGKTADSMTVRFPQALVINLGESPKTAYPDRRPTTRMGTAALLRNAFAAAANYRQKLKSAKEPDSVDTDLKNQAILQAMEQKIASFIVAQRADDLLTALRLAREYNLRAVLAMGAEAYLVPDQIRDAKLPVVVHPSMQRIGEMETFNSFVGNAAVLDSRRIPLAISSGFEGYVPKTRVIRQEAAMAMVYGLGFEKALASITIDAAKILQIEDRYGSLESGKVADLVLYDGHPFEITTHVTHVISAGRLAYDRAKDSRIPLAARSGHGAEPACCLFF